MSPLPPPPPPFSGPTFIHHLHPSLSSSHDVIPKPIDDVIFPSPPPPSPSPSSNPCLDLFFQVVPTTPPSTLTSLLSAAWAHQPLTALKLVSHLRSVRGTGKSDKKSFYTAAIWLHHHHPKTLALNLPSFAASGYLKDLLEILFLLINGSDSRKKPVKMKKKKEKKPIKKRLASEDTINDRIMTELKKLNLLSNPNNKKKNAKVEKKKNLAIRALRLYIGDEQYRFLYDQVAEFFARNLKSDLEELKQGNLHNVSLAAKWCPSLDSSYDRSTLICESIARRIWPKESSDAEFENIEDAHYAYRVRDRLRREILVPIRKVLELPEVYMSAQNWEELPYGALSSVAMSNYSKIFKKHDKARFLKCLKEGKAKVAAGALLPHEIVAAVNNDETAEVAELQWRRMVGDLAEKGKLKNCIALCDVCQGMGGDYCEKALALGLLVSELSEEPWKLRLITFSSMPQLHRIEGETVKQKMGFVKKIVKGYNTDIQSVFDRLLEVAVAGKLDREAMVKRVFVFSDMEFDSLYGSKWGTDYEAICGKFEEKGYGSCVPEIVFWNLGGPKAMPVSCRQNGVALVSGFSKNLVRVFVDRDGEMNPEAIMEDAISGEEYEKLVVCD